MEGTFKSEAFAWGPASPRPYVGAWERRIAGWVVRTAFGLRRRGGPWPVPRHLDAEPIAFQGNTGARVRGTYFPLDPHSPRPARLLGAQGLREPRGVVVLVHPDRRYAGHWFVKEGWIDWLASHGFETLTFDLPYYGQSHGPSHYYPEDVLAAAAFARRWSAGLPVHAIGLSMGAFALAGASPWLDGVESAVLESPYPTFADWYATGWGHLASKACERLFRRSMQWFDAPARIRDARVRRLLVAASACDEVTPLSLSRRVADAAPAERTRFLEVPDAPHLGLFRDATYRTAVLETLGLPQASLDAVVAARPILEENPGPGRIIRPLASAPTAV